MPVHSRFTDRYQPCVRDSAFPPHAMPRAPIVTTNRDVFPSPLHPALSTLVRNSFIDRSARPYGWRHTTRQSGFLLGNGLQTSSLRELCRL